MLRGGVLILVLMEDTLRVTACIRDKKQDGVLILVLMEDTLREYNQSRFLTRFCCLNPCFNGRYSQRLVKAVKRQSGYSLNPCFNGRYSQRATIKTETAHLLVLILVLMEDTLRGVFRFLR